MTPIHAVITETDGKLRATLLTPDNQTVENVVLKTFVPLGHEMIQIAFCGMSSQRAQFLSIGGIERTLAALALATADTAKDGEKWYALTVKFTGSGRDRLANELSILLDSQKIGWLNPIVLTTGSGEYLFDLALTDESTGRAAIDGLMQRWKVKQWNLTIKPNGL